jgi:hypothetical protein
MTDVHRAIFHAAATLGISHEAAELLPARVVAALWEEKYRQDAGTSAAATAKGDQDERDDDR